MGLGWAHSKSNLGRPFHFFRRFTSFSCKKHLQSVENAQSVHFLHSYKNLGQFNVKKCLFLAKNQHSSRLSDFDVFNVLSDIVIR